MKKRRGVLLAVVAMAVAMTIPGCGSWFDFPPRLEYVANHDGNYFAGDRCGRAISEVAVFLERRELLNGGFVGSLGDAVWYARADPPIEGEFQLFTRDQPGTIVVSDEWVGQSPETVYVYIRFPSQTGDFWEGLKVPLHELKDGKVVTWTWGVMTWKRYLRETRRSCRG